MEPRISFSVIVPTYNRANLIAKTLATLQSQDYNDYEIIVVDDGSTDNTEEVVNNMASVRTKYYKKTNAERAVARNYGAKIATSEYVNFFDSDDLALSNHLSEAAKMVKDHNRPEWFHLGYEWASPDGKVFKKVNGFAGAQLNDILSSGNVLSCNGVFVRKDIILKNLFNEDRALSASEDYELWMRLAARYPLYFSNIITSVVVDHDARSVREVNTKKLIERVSLLLHYLKQDEQVKKIYGKNFHKIDMELNSYIALHLANKAKGKLKSIHYTLKAFRNSKALLKRRRFYAIIKNILIKW